MLSRPSRRNPQPRCSRRAGLALHSPRRPASSPSPRPASCPRAWSRHSWQAFGSSRPGRALVGRMQASVPPKVARFLRTCWEGPCGKKTGKKFRCTCEAVCRRKEEKPSRKSLTEFVLCVVGKELKDLNWWVDFLPLSPRSLIRFGCRCLVYGS